MYENEERITETEVVDGLRALLYGESLEDTLYRAAVSAEAKQQDIEVGAFHIAIDRGFSQIDAAVCFQVER